MSTDGHKSSTHDDLGGRSLLELFRTEADSQAQVLNEGLLALERDDTGLERIEPLMRAAHSLKGAARIVGLDPIERLAHVMEDCFVAAQKGQLTLTHARVDRLLAAVDLISELSALDEGETSAWLESNNARMADLLVGLYDASDPATEKELPRADGLEVENRSPGRHSARSPVEHTIDGPTSTPAPTPTGDVAVSPETRPEPRIGAPAGEYALRVDVSRFDRLLALAGESRVASHALHPHLQALQRVRQRQRDANTALEHARAAGSKDERTLADFDAVHQKFAALEQQLVLQLADLEVFERRMLSLTQDLLDEVLYLRMRPFREGVRAFPRMVRDLARDLGKEARLEIAGEDTLVDRDVLAQMEAPLNQILRNAVDHGIEPAAQRVAAGKPPYGTIVLKALHNAGMLQIEVRDDGRGLDLQAIRDALVARGMSTSEMSDTMSATELLDFLLLPGFSLKKSAGPISGRGVGLDVVAASVRRMNGMVRLETEPQYGFSTLITLPLSQSLISALVVVVAGESLALPIARIARALRLAPQEVHMLAERQFFTHEGHHIDLIALAPLLELGQGRAQLHSDPLSVLLIGDDRQRYGLVVDAIVGQQNLAARPLDPVFGKIRDVSATALLDNGSPVLILDSADLLQSIEKLADEGGLQRLAYTQEGAEASNKRVLVVDDSLTVREMERKLLLTRGFEVDLAVDGVDGWNAVRSREYDLVITDVDMPRMDGIELVNLIKKDDRLRNLPVMIVSYKDRPEDRTRGIDAGADYYLAKGSFHDETLLEAVIDLIGESDS